MPPKKNPLKLNPLQLRTLALFQELARYPDTSTKDEATGEVTISALPHLHGLSCVLLVTPLQLPTC